MPEFISKLQYKTSENGEYFDEKGRNVEETIALIENFPWDKEQYADVELTGPSITITDLNGNYLKVGIHFGGRFHLYYLDINYHLYEYYPITLDKAITKVREFFNGNIDLANFEKQNFAYLQKSYFLTNQFEYTVKLWKVLLMNIFWILYFIISFVFAIAINIAQPFGPSGLIMIIVSVIFGGVIFRSLEKFYQKRRQYLKISRGNNLFLFSDGKEEVTLYNKADIKKIINYVNKASRSPNNFEVLEIVFNNDSSIFFTNALISNYTLSSKFSDKWNLLPVSVEKGLFDLMRLIP